jgi:hypothetical protein
MVAFAVRAIGCALMAMLSLWATIKVIRARRARDA